MAGFLVGGKSIALWCKGKNGLINKHVDEPFPKKKMYVCVAQDFVSVGAKSE